MSEEEKKGGEYDKPESKEMGGEELEDVSGGAGTGAESICKDGSTANMQCLSGPSPTGQCSNGGNAYYHAGCSQGSTPGKPYA